MSAPMPLAASPVDADASLLASARAGDEAAFAQLVQRHHAGLMRIARLWVRDAALAEEVVQEAWATFVEELDRFEGRAALRTWLCGITLNHARNRARRERRLVPWSALAGEESGPLLDDDRFQGAAGLLPGNWARPPLPWPDPEHSLLGAELRRLLSAAIEELPEVQRAVVVLRDVEGLSGEEACNVLGLSDTNLRVLLHRARTRLRARLEGHYHGGGET